jgi:hypothetical protein
VRKLWKLPAICCEASALLSEAELDELPAGRGVVPETTDGAVVADVDAMLFSSDPDVDAAARAEQAAV